MDWRPVAGFPLYEVSDTGLLRNSRSGRLLRPRFLSARGGYPIFDLHSGARYGLAERAKRVTKRLNILVCEAFHGPAPAPNLDAAHRDGDVTNCTSGNLRWATRASNLADRERHGTVNSRERNGGAKLVTREVEALRVAWLSGDWSQRALASLYGISQTQISRIVNRRKWK